MPLIRRLVVAGCLAAVALTPLELMGSAHATPAQESAIDAAARRLRPTIGAPTSGFVSTHWRGTEITYRRYRHGMLAHNGQAVRMVSGPILSAYDQRSGPRGRLGAPLLAQRCGLLEGACIQRFQNGAVYWNPRAPGKNKRVAYGTGRIATYIAVARSQAGYVEPGYRQNKYGKWLTGKKALRRPWCSFFQSWVSAASGNGTAAAPRKKRFSSFVKAVRKRGGLTSKVAVGDFAFIDYFHDGRTSHVGLVIKVTKKKVTLVEGNIHVPGNAPSGVHVNTRRKSQVTFYAPIL